LYTASSFVESLRHNRQPSTAGQMDKPVTKIFTTYQDKDRKDANHSQRPHWANHGFKGSQSIRRWYNFDCHGTRK
jgi:hypothetical protein